MLSPGIWWHGIKLTLYGSDIQNLQMNSYSARPGGVITTAKQPGDKSGRGAPNKLPFLAAVATRDGKPSAIHLRPVTGFTRAAIGDDAARNLAAGSAVVSDGLRCFDGFAAAGPTHVSIRTGSGKRPGEPALAWGNTVLGNIKAALTATCRAVPPRLSVNTQRPLAHFAPRRQLGNQEGP